MKSDHILRGVVIFVCIKTSLASQPIVGDREQEIAVLQKKIPNVRCGHLQ